MTSDSNSYFLALSLLSSSWTDHRLSKHRAVLHQPDSAASLSPPLASPPPPACLHPGIPHFTRCPHLPHRPHPAATQTWSLSPDPGGLSPLWGCPPPRISDLGRGCRKPAFPPQHPEGPGFPSLRGCLPPLHRAVGRLPRLLSYCVSRHFSSSLQKKGTHVRAPTRHPGSL